MRVERLAVAGVRSERTIGVLAGLFEKPNVDQHARNTPVRLIGFWIQAERPAEFLDRALVREAVVMRPEQITAREVDLG